jgi:hypothetical protein
VEPAEALIVRAVEDAAVPLLLVTVLPPAGAGVPMISMLAVAVGVTPAAAVPLPLPPPPQAASKRGTAPTTVRTWYRDSLTSSSPSRIFGGLRLHGSRLNNRSAKVSSA